VTLFTTFRVNTRPYTGYVDPSLPIGAWIASGSATGNATGGSLFMAFLVQIAETQRVTELYNLEQLAVHIDELAIVRGIMRTEQMDVLNPNVRATEVQAWQLDLQAGESPDAALPLASSTVLPLWLGAPTDGDVDAGLQFEFANANGRVHHVTCQGYIWGPRCVVAPGGPQRPPFGFYGR